MIVKNIKYTFYKDVHIVLLKQFNSCKQISTSIIHISYIFVV